MGKKTLYLGKYLLVEGVVNPEPVIQKGVSLARQAGPSPGKDRSLFPSPILHPFPTPKAKEYFRRDTGMFLFYG